MDYRQLFMSLSESLQANSHIDVLKNVVGESVPGDDLSYQLALKRFGITLFEKLLDFYYSMSYCHIEWQCNLNDHTEIVKFHPDDTMVFGQIIIRSIDEMLEFDKKLEADWWVRNLESDEKAALYDFRYFDFNDDNIRAGFIKEQNVISEDKFYFIEQDSEGFNPVNLSFENYLEIMILYKGYQGWQRNHFFKNTTNYKRMVHYLDQLFQAKITG